MCSARVWWIIPLSIWLLLVMLYMYFEFPVLASHKAQPVSRPLHTYRKSYKTPQSFSKVSIVMRENRKSIGIFAASLAQKHSYAQLHDYGFFLDSTDLKGNYNTPDVKGPDYSLEGTWGKIYTALSATEYVPEGSWIWIMDSDVIIMNMNKSVDYLVEKASAAGKSFIFTVWNCGDGMNAGSWMVRNNRFGRLLLNRVIDSYHIWDQYFFTGGGVGRSEQGAIWVLSAGDTSVSGLMFEAPPRELNARENASDVKCAQGNPKLHERVFFHPGDLLVHMTGIRDSTVWGRDLFENHLSSTGWFPCGDRCSRNAIDQISTEFEPTFIGTTTSKLSSIVTSSATVLRNDKNIPVHDLTKPSYDWYSGMDADTTSDSKGGHYFPNNGDGWGVLPFIRTLLNEPSISNTTEWVLVCQHDAECDVQMAMGLVSKISSDSSVIVSKGCNRGFWMVPKNERGFSFVSRLADGFLLRHERLHVKGFIKKSQFKSEAAKLKWFIDNNRTDEFIGFEDRCSMSEAICMFIEKGDKRSKISVF